MYCLKAKPAPLVSGAVGARTVKRNRHPKTLPISRSEKAETRARCSKWQLVQVENRWYSDFSSATKTGFCVQFLV